MSEQHSPLSTPRVGTPTAERSMNTQATESAELAGHSSGRRRNDRIISASAAMQEVVDQASEIARGDGLIVLSGPSGSGRQHVGRAIHQWSARAGGPLLELQLAGSNDAAHSRELFGDVGTAGALSRAQGGTLLLENADQLGGTLLARVMDALRAAATPPRLIATVGPGAETPLTSIGATEIRVAALADRTEDILPLAAHFLAEFASDLGVDPVGFSADARRWLVEEPWTGNVRELRERIRQAIRLSGQGAISAEALMLSTEGDEVPSFKEAKRAFETRYVEGLLRRCSGNISRAARMAKKDRKDFYDVIRRTGVDPAQFRG